MARAADLPWFDYKTESKPTSYRVRSLYLPMRDGVRIAVDLYLPQPLGAGKKIPTILHSTRYFRSIELRGALKRWVARGRPFDHTGMYFRRRIRFLRAGYAWMDIDARGSGASFGRRICPWSPDEIKDGGEIVDWIVSQPWSNGKAGATGISYDGSAAEFLLLNKHPAVRAVAPRFSSFDPYRDIAFPGGIHNAWFTNKWQKTNAALDRNRPDIAAGLPVRPFVTGVSPVDEDADRSLLRVALAQRANLDVHQNALDLTFCDDVSQSDPFHSGEMGFDRLAAQPESTEGSIGLFSASNYVSEIDASGAAVYAYSGWLDGGYARGAVSRYLQLSNPANRLTLGPWNHGGGWHCDPAVGPVRSSFKHDAELLRFFDHHLKGIATGLEGEPPVHYYTMGEERWKSASEWPPKDSQDRVFRLGADRTLAEGQRAEPGSVARRLTPDTHTGKSNRWRKQAEPDKPVRYAERSTQDRKMIVFDTLPLEGPLEATGHPVARLYLSCDQPDWSLFLYLEDLHPNGRVTLVTEGQLRALHRRERPEKAPNGWPSPHHTFRREDGLPYRSGEIIEMAVDLLPISYLFRSGHAIRLAIGVADRSQFVTISQTPHDLCVYCDKEYDSRLFLPLVSREG